MKQRVAEQLKTASIKNYTTELDESAERDDGTTLSDDEDGQHSPGRRSRTSTGQCRSIQDLKTVLTELRTGNASPHAPPDTSDAS